MKGRKYKLLISGMKKKIIIVDSADIKRTTREYYKLSPSI